MPSLLRSWFAPLSLAAYAAWLAVWFTVDGAAARAPEQGLWIRAAMLYFLFAFMAEDLVGRYLGLGGFIALAVSLLVAALLPIALAPQGAGPILLVLLAALLAARFEGWPLALALALQNLALLLVMLLLWSLPWRYWLITLTAYGSFQIFAAMLMRSTVRAEDMAGQLRAANAELLTSRSLLAAHSRDQERLRLSRELHDVAGHGLTALKLNLAVLARDPAQPDRSRVELCAGLADELLQNLRRVVSQMRQAPGIDLEAALRRLALPFPRPQLRLAIEPGLNLESPAEEEAVLRAVQEALTNAARHGHADRLEVRLGCEHGRYRLIMEDNGAAPVPSRPGGGLAGMGERFQQLGGDLQIERSGLGGLRLAASWPQAGSR